MHIWATFVDLNCQAHDRWELGTSSKLVLWINIKFQALLLTDGSSCPVPWEGKTLVGTVLIIFYTLLEIFYLRKKMQYDS